MTDDYRLLTCAEAAKLLRVRETTVRELVETGQLRAVTVGGRYRVMTLAVRAYQESLAVEDLIAEETGAPARDADEIFKPGRHGIPLTVRFQTLKRCNFTCTYCGRKPPEVVLHVDHIVAVANGGTNRPSNLTAACRDCNLGKRTETVDLEVEE